MGTTDGGKALYEALDDIKYHLGAAEGLADASFDTILDAIKRALINPQGQTARDLMTAVTTYENVRSVVLPAYDEGR